MPLEIGNVKADSGMSELIYVEMNELLSPPLLKAINDAQDDEDDKARDAGTEALTEARKNWKKLAYAIAKGVITHIEDNMEVYGIRTMGEVKTAVTGNTGASNPNNHRHGVNLSGKQENVEFTQSNDGKGHVK